MKMSDFNLRSRYNRNASVSNNRSMSRSDLVFQKLKKYEEKYKSNRNLISAGLNRGLFETDSEPDIEQYEAMVTKCTVPRGIQHDLTSNHETSKSNLQKVEAFATVESLRNGNLTSLNERPHGVANKSLIIDLKVDNVHLVNSDNSKISFITNSFRSTCHDRSCITPKKSVDASKPAAEQNLIHETMTSSLKTSDNNNLVESDTSNDLNNLHRHIMLEDCHTDPDSDHMYSNSFSTDNKISIHNDNKNESKKVELYLTDEMKEIQQPSHLEIAEKSQKQNINHSHCDPLSNREKPHEDLESIRTEIFPSDSDVTTYDVPDISNSFDMDVKEKSESSNLGIVVTSEPSVISGDYVAQNTDDKTVSGPTTNTVTDGPSNSVISPLTKSNESLRKENKPQTDETHCYCKTKSTQTNININFLHHTNDLHLTNTISEEDIGLVLSPYSLFVYRYLLHGNPQDPTKKDTDCAMSFLNKCLREQVNITQHLINSHQATYNAYCTAARKLSKNYQPITLENTMQFINQNKNKKRRNVLSS